MLGSTILPKPLSNASVEVTLNRPGKDSGIAEMRSVEFKLNGNAMCVSTLRDVTELVRLREELRALTVIDELLDLCNRRGFFMFAQQQIKLAKRNKKGLYLLLVSINNLAQAKSNGGEQVSGNLLIGMSRVLRDTFRKSDIIARVAEETFAILAIDVQIGGTDIMANRLAGNLEKYNIKANAEEKVMASMGSAYYNPEQPCSLDELVGYADMLLQHQQRGERQSALIWYMEQSGTAQKLPSAVP
jgi:diguanylate cyclase (GGDEF)-like protein